jgi:hypothetical protein
MDQAFASVTQINKEIRELELVSEIREINALLKQLREKLEKKWQPQS